jgi:dCMP deaminase
MMPMLPAEERSAMAIAYHAAALSPDPSTQNGAYVINMMDGSLRGAIGRNMPLRGNAVDWTSDAKNHTIHHAEEAAILAAAAHGIPTFGATLFSPWIACTRCARAIVGARIGRVVGHRDLVRQAALINPKWTPEIARGLEMIVNANIEISWLHGSINGSTIRHAGNRWNPMLLKLNEENYRD